MHCQFDNKIGNNYILTFTNTHDWKTKNEVIN